MYIDIMKKNRAFEKVADIVNAFDEFPDSKRCYFNIELLQFSVNCIYFTISVYSGGTFI